MSIQIKGAEKLQKKLDQLAKKDARKALRAATRAGTAALLKGVKREVPVDEGDLKRAQTSKVTGRGSNLNGIVGADVAKLKDGESKGRPSNIDHLVEFGHVATDGTFVPPSGYVRRGSAQSLPTAQQKFASVLKDKLT
jgi:HK97 gp10 family phage protein